MVKNYRNLKDIDIHLNDIVALIGENSSGKSNLLRAVTFPFLTDEAGFSGKKLSWVDINDDAKATYYRYIIDNQAKIKQLLVNSLLAICQQFSWMLIWHPKQRKTILLRISAFQLKKGKCYME